MTKRRDRHREALRRLGGQLPTPEPERKCACPLWIKTPCSGAPTRVRPYYDGTSRWYCVEHDPVRMEEEAKNAKQRFAQKKARWKAMERER